MVCHNSDMGRKFASSRYSFLLWRLRLMASALETHYQARPQTQEVKDYLTLADVPRQRRCDEDGD